MIHSNFVDILIVLAAKNQKKNEIKSSRILEDTKVGGRRNYHIYIYLIPGIVKN